MPPSKTAANKDSGGSPTAGQLSSEDKDRLVEIWKKAVETQMHFNEMSGKSRQLGLTFVAAALGVAVVMLARGEDFALSIAGWQIHVGVLLVLAAALALWGVQQLDLGVYHRMLRGAVTFGEDFENNYMRHIFELNKGMTGAISHFSRSEGDIVDKSGEKYVYVKGKVTTAENKIRRFYRNTNIFLIAAAFLLFMIINFDNLSRLVYGVEGPEVEQGQEMTLPASARQAPSAEVHVGGSMADTESGDNE